MAEKFTSHVVSATADCPPGNPITVWRTGTHGGVLPPANPDFWFQFLAKDQATEACDGEPCKKAESKEPQQPVDQRPLFAYDPDEFERFQRVFATWDFRNGT